MTLNLQPIAGSTTEIKIRSIYSISIFNSTTHWKLRLKNEISVGIHKVQLLHIIIFHFFQWMCFPAALCHFVYILLIQANHLLHDT